MSNQQESIRSFPFISEKKFQPSCSSKQIYTSSLPVYKFKLNNMHSLLFCKIWCHLYASSLTKHFYHFSLPNIFPHNCTQYKSRVLALPFVGSHTAPFLIILHHIRTTLFYSSTLMRGNICTYLQNYMPSHPISIVISLQISTYTLFFLQLNHVSLWL